MNKIVVLAGMLALSGQIGCTSKIEEKKEIVTYSVTSPLTVDTSFTKEYVSQIRAVRDIEIRSQEKGFLQNIYVDEGQYVKAGQLLFRIMPKMYETEALKAEAEVKAAEVELLNTQSLADKDIVSKNELSMAKAKLAGAKAGHSLAKIHLSFTEIRAPFNGYIDRIPKKLGSLIDEGELLTTLSDNSDVYAYFNLSEPEYLSYQEDKKGRADTNVNLLLANNNILKYKGEVQTVESEFENETGNIAFRARFPNPDGLLRNGETGKVLMKIPLKNTLIIPQKATYEIQDKIYVFVVGKDNVIHSQPIAIRGELPDLYVVESGLGKDDKILLEGIQNVKDGDKIKFKYENPTEVAANLKLKAE
jgi:membrane fusion protein (multidrug efflux system)